MRPCLLWPSGGRQAGARLAPHKAWHPATLPCYSCLDCSSEIPSSTQSSLHHPAGASMCRRDVAEGGAAAAVCYGRPQGVLVWPFMTPSFLAHPSRADCL